MKKTVRIATVAAVLTLSGSAFAAGKCETAGTVTQELWGKYGAMATDAAASKGGAAGAAAAGAEQIDKMIKFWNDKVGSSWAKVGPRRLDFDGTNAGTVQSAGDRAWISAYPAQGPVTIDFKKTDGAGKAEVTVCKVDGKNKATPVKSFEIDAGDKDGKSWEIPVADAAGHIIVVVVDGKSVTKKVEYAFTAKAK